MKTFRRQPSSLPVIYICNSLTRVNIITRLFNCKMLRIFSKILDHTRLPKITPLGNRFDYRFFSHNLHKRKCSNQRGNGAKNRIKRFDIHMNRGSTQLPTERHTTKNQISCRLIGDHIRPNGCIILYVSVVMIGGLSAHST
ncbi:uncharacterized protein LOC113349984 isoform X3 [Papaver somniferum]|uniref:uncharacterized protein LOC113349984 isoform X3 n=1 Tax=Papaver somniferum TaxID=3469 RepID=UPI000E701F30|nr:uncharacterized protein LOC113349984 isoform X3 [Papaver somniferum]